MNYSDLTRGVFDLTARRTPPAPLPPPAAPVFTKQPGADSNITGHAGNEPDTTYTPFTVGKAAIISAPTATVESGATLDLEWQKLDADGKTWLDTGITTAQFSLASPQTSDEGSYRVLAVADKNGLQTSATSQIVDFKSRFLFLQNDTQNTGPLAVAKVDNDHYTMNVPAGSVLQAIGAFVRLPSNPGNNNGGMGAPRIDSAVSDNTDAVTIDSTASRQTKLRFPKAGIANLTIKVSNLTSVLKITVT